MTASVLVVPMNYAGEIVFTVANDDRAPDITTLVLPSGPIGGDKSPEVAAAHVLQTRNGLRAEVTFPLGTLRLTCSTVHLYLVRNLVPARHIGDAIYTIETKRVLFDNIEELIAAGQLRDAVVIAALFLARSFVSGTYNPNV